MATQKNLGGLVGEKNGSWKVEREWIRQDSRETGIRAQRMGGWGGSSPGVQTFTHYCSIQAKIVWNIFAAVWEFVINIQILQSFFSYFSLSPSKHDLVCLGLERIGAVYVILDWGQLGWLAGSSHRQSWKMSNLLHGPISTNQILPWEKRVNGDIFGTSNLQNRTYDLWWINVDLSISSQSCKMSRIWRIYPCKEIGQLG